MPTVQQAPPVDPQSPHESEYVPSVCVACPVCVGWQSTLQLTEGGPPSGWYQRTEQTSKGVVTVLQVHCGTPLLSEEVQQCSV